jgi:hypothetical protein
LHLGRIAHQHGHAIDQLEILPVRDALDIGVELGDGHLPEFFSRLHHNCPHAAGYPITSRRTYIMGTFPAGLNGC